MHEVFFLLMGGSSEGWNPKRRLGGCPGDSLKEAFREVKGKTSLRFNINFIPPGHTELHYVSTVGMSDVSEMRTEERR
jgi:hypothetical protein